ncbi:membrane-bound lytic murein transglycosylase MltF [Pleionea sp. CnH1-48]|uniref:membrane-bound lytic murein transglycosylase MltF n=1 Tax=Pleionea sp. CnH1-48 TaxID=2954494 RepID=UPI0020983429|nr:membrane-bound lytic murein transglycosylase MltF [Pleionea sp. CnH1-48]MCO7226402.1 membrane-bound lytic murein transglycosylase MltF [Pleionea sp. CnH1-48]
MSFITHLRQFTARSATLVTSVLMLLTLTACQEPQLTRLEQIKKSGILRVVTRNSPTTYYVQKDGPAGIEYELATQFADYLGVTPVFVPEDSIKDIFDAVENGQADFAAAGLTVTGSRSERVRFASPYQSTTSKLVFKQGKTWPRNFGQLNGKLRVLAHSSHSAALLEMKKQFPKLSWTETEEHTQEELLDMVLNETLDYTIVDSVALDLNRRYNTELVIAFTVGEPQQLAWAFAKDNDFSLFSEAVEFFGEQQQSGRVSQLVEQYYGHVAEFDYVDARTFLKSAQEKLEPYKEMFQKSAKDDLDWRLLAAIGYQESHWNPKARSSTGVRGIMMLTQRTAKQMGVTHRLHPEQSIEGGAQYLRRMLKRVPERIGEPDRTWFALAAYNIGWGHVEDARIITQKQGADPDKWVDVKERLPLLRQKRYYKQTRFGYARGNEPVDYVTNIRRYYDVLLWLNEERPDRIELQPGEMVASNDDTPSEAHPRSQLKPLPEKESKSHVD